MANISSPSQARIPIGMAVVNGQSVQVTINQEWARFFESLTAASNGSAAVGEAGRAGANGAGLMLSGDGGDSVEFIPGPPGQPGQQGAPGPALYMLQETDAPAEMLLIPAPQGSEAIIAPALLNGWTYFGAGYSTVGYYKDRCGVVHLRGLLGGGAGAMFNLPAGYRPAMTGNRAVIAENALGRVDVSTTGDVALYLGGNAYVSLDGITFRAA
jgi:hypothetical protein